MINTDVRSTIQLTPAALSPKALHDSYIDAVNAAVAAGNEDLAAELAAAYLSDVRDAEAARHSR